VTGLTGFTEYYFGFPPARHRKSEADSGQACGDETKKIKSLSTKEIRIILLILLILSKT
jgi:hypothetical protein